MTRALCAHAHAQRALLERAVLPGLVALLGDAQADGAYAAAAALFNACALHADAREAALAALAVGPLVQLLSADSWCEKIPAVARNLAQQGPASCRE